METTIVKPLTKLLRRLLVSESGGWGWGWNSGGMPPGGGGGSHLIHDTFTDDDDTALDSHTPDVDSQAGGWSLEAGSNTTIQSNQVQISTGNKDAFIDAGTANVDVSVEYTFPPSTGGYAQNLYRYADASNMLHTLAWETANVYRLYKIVDSSSTQLASVSQSYTGSQTYTMRVTVDSNHDHEAFLDGSSLLTVSNENANSANTNVGFYDSAGGNGRHDNFEVYEN